MNYTSDFIRMTPFLGGSTNGGVCSLLDIGGFNILLDCGRTINNEIDLVSRIDSELYDTERSIDIVILSHADMQHLGSLPNLLGKNGDRTTRVVCTLPVFKFGQLMLYDYCLNKDMEGTSQKSAQEFNASYDLDDVDLAFSNLTTVKFSQSITISGNTESGSSISLCAYPSGRTVGGSIWRITCGSTDILYCMDSNLRKEVVLDGANLDALPSSPAMLIVDGGSSTAAPQGRKRREKDDFIPSIMETVRGNGNVLLPCETAGRALEILQVLAAYWAQNKLDMYHLVFLSPMAINVLEFARSQLEWMSDSLSKSFYNGRPNPFDLTKQLKICTSVRELERQYPGPKVVLATDSSLTCGFAKDLLLRWGGDPRCKIIFTDSSDPNTLAAELRGHAPGAPVVVTVTKPLRVELEGEELAEYREENERKRREEEEAAQRKRRETEIEELAAAGQQDNSDDDDDDDAEEEDEEFDGDGGAAVAGTGAGSTVTGAVELKRGSSAASSSGATVPGSNSKRRKLQSGLISKFLQPNFPMFETREVVMAFDEYGAGIDDLKFQDINSTSFARPGRDKETGRRIQAKTLARTDAAAATETVDPHEDPLDLIPTKLVPTTMRVQFKCAIKEVSMGARADQRAVKTIVTKLTPARVVVLRGEPSDCAAVAVHARSIGAEAFTPTDGEVIFFRMLTGRLRIQIPQELLATSCLKEVRGVAGGGGGAGEYSASSVDSEGTTKVHIRSLSGPVLEQRVEGGTGPRGVRLVQLCTTEQAIQHNFAVAAVEDSSELARKASSRRHTAVEGVNDISTESTTTAAAAASERDDDDDVYDVLDLGELRADLVSVGEVMINTLKQKIEQRGISVVFQLGTTGAGSLLVCAQQVIVRKESGNNFVIEGPPVPAYWEVRKALYEHFAFV